RAWESPNGNLAATFMVVTGMAPADAAQISFVAALAASDLVRAFVDPAKVRVKWPNDIMIGDEKCAGILVESGKAPDGRLWLAVGVGVNLAHPPQISERPATTLARHMPPPPPEPPRAIEGLAAAFEDWRHVWHANGFAAIGKAWINRAYRLGETCTARLPAETVTGIAEGLDGDGALRLRLADGSLRRITAGDVFFETALGGS
ncbi:MAG TPA: biotin--[acetyl-CoA-carboxylase] ligase, partial [Caulobacteraceae bacterium]|nr:biotin--[acetyl-CoA-carboxylase] ligase [Caulobacteraceae bacterium]